MKTIIEKVFLYEWFEEDMDVILEDYQRITEKIKQGKAHELSESDGNYLSTCTKGAGKGKDFRSQPFSSEPAKQRAWELKSSYMTYLINHKIFNQTEQESVVATARGEKKPFTEVVAEKILAYKGFSEEELYARFDINPKAKGKNSSLIRKILGLTGDIEKTQEFQKADMNLRVIRVDKNRLPKRIPLLKLTTLWNLRVMMNGKSPIPILKFAINAFYLLCSRKCLQNFLFR